MFLETDSLILLKKKREKVLIFFSQKLHYVFSLWTIIGKNTKQKKKSKS
jgi:hypothetical protein